ncbi:pulmonary surfactant-associated protein D-like isoform X27 [Haliotis rubra]|uniref:pulmonary surfactant-associated protein D-like isoform X27 n=1 Tax=Haliotis rubra TaxID=36100 RepID=UPI001EE59E5C|nr:pulmonary surfactant-associated protein D-like isoform X27 [Haliotis rubra]
MTPRLHRMTACVTAMAVAVVVMDAVEAFSHTTSIGFSASTPGIQSYDEGGNALFINEAFPLVSGRLLQICFYIHKNFDNNYTGTFFVLKKTERGYRLVFQQNVVFPNTQGRHCVNMTEPPLVINGQFVGWMYDQDAGPISYTIPDQESGTMVANNVHAPLVVGQTYGSRSFTKTYFFMLEAIVDIGDAVATGPAGDAVATGPAGDVVVTGPAGDAVVTGPAGDAVATGPAGDAVVTGPAGDAVVTGPAGDAVATGPAGDAVATGPAGDAVATGPAGDAVATGPAGDAVATGPAGDAVETGPAGDAVETGPAGDAVASGPAGDAVETGPAGDAVASGPAGDAVASGPAGDAVATGPAGDAVSKWTCR